MGTSGLNHKKSQEIIGVYLLKYGGYLSIRDFSCKYLVMSAKFPRSTTAIQLYNVDKSELSQLRNPESGSFVGEITITTVVYQ